MLWHKSEESHPSPVQVYTMPSRWSVVTGSHRPVANLRGATLSWDCRLSRRHVADVSEIKTSPIAKARSALLSTQVPFSA